MPLEVTAVSLPFVACGLLQPGGDQIGPVILDVRGLRLMEVSRKFVAAIRGFRQGASSRGPDAVSKAEPSSSPGGCLASDGGNDAGADSGEGRELEPPSLIAFGSGE
jgi:hypothetical protein